jgi:hypothetical protein
MPAIMIWELRGESCTDQHPHSEYAYVLEGQLLVESGGSGEARATSLRRHFGRDDARMDLRATAFA